MIKVDEDATIALHPSRIDKDIPNANVTVQNTRDVMKFAMSYMRKQVRVLSNKIRQILRAEDSVMKG